MKRTVFLLTLTIAVVAVSGLAVAQINPKDGNPAGPASPNRAPRPNLGPGSPFCSAPGSPIDSALPPTVDTINVPDNFVLVDLNVSLLITHTWVGDLDVVLDHAGGCGPITILNRPGEAPPNTGLGCSEDNIDATLDDEGGDGNAEDQCNVAPPAVGPGDFVAGDLPDNTLLSACDGESVNGDWTLTITDNAGGDTGTLDEWCLITDPVVPVELQTFSID